MRLSAFFLLLLTLPAAAQSIEGFDSFIAGFRSKALAAGVSGTVYDAAMAGLTADPKAPNLVSTQPEFTTTMWDYIEGRVTRSRIARGKDAMARNQTLFASVGAAYGVDPYILGAIWGMETDYGAVLGNAGLIRPIVRSLATLVHQRRTRLAEDEGDLIAALKLVQQGPLDAKTLVGSWAGAIGHLQVNPSNVVVYGTDGDGRVDLHHSLVDALASSARYLRGLGYQPGLDWGHGSGGARGVRLSAGHAHADATRLVLCRTWRHAGSGTGVCRWPNAGVSLCAGGQEWTQIPDDAELSGAQGL